MTEIEEKPQDELEQKITEAEIKAQEQEISEGDEAPSSFEEVPVEVTEEAPPEKKELSRARKIWRKILIWLVVIAIAIGGGSLLYWNFRYKPLEADLNSAQAEIVSLNDEIDRLGSEIDSLNDEIDRLGTFEDQNTALVEEIDQLDIHLVILSLRAGVADASLALEQGRQADAGLALDKVGSSLDMLQGMLNEDQAEVVENMIQRYQLVMLELEHDGATVQTDLELLSSKLLTLENTLFATP